MPRDRTPYSDKELKEEIERIADFSPKRAATYQELLDRRKKDKSQQCKNCTASNNNHSE